MADNKTSNGGFETSELTRMITTVDNLSKAVAATFDALLFEEHASGLVDWPRGPLAGKEWEQVIASRMAARKAYERVDGTAGKCSKALLEFRRMVDRFTEAQQKAKQRPISRGKRRK
jgi:hypothetical protein